jgi:hypothetical protein
MTTRTLSEAQSNVTLQAISTLNTYAVLTETLPVAPADVDDIECGKFVTSIGSIAPAGGSGAVGVVTFLRECSETEYLATVGSQGIFIAKVEPTVAVTVGAPLTISGANGNVGPAASGNVVLGYAIDTSDGSSTDETDAHYIRYRAASPSIFP